MHEEKILAAIADMERRINTSFESLEARLKEIRIDLLELQQRKRQQEE
ncbi:MAG: hypothetical protein FWD06_05985 [Oscillospiraceae bacterium]|nr:hypothetical protein [Oscillospiraceae bacterium]